MNLKEQLLQCIENLLIEYEQNEKCGIFFKVEKDRDPMEIIGVLDFLKNKIENWGNSNIFSYLGHLFNNDNVLVIGSNNTEEAKNIIKYVYLTQIHKIENQFNHLISIFKNCKKLESYLNNEIKDNIEVGFPSDPKLELNIKNHLRKILFEN
ncbi:MAG: hypothetical protein ACFFDB_04810 [Promethearchaeota archaeon]